MWKARHETVRIRGIDPAGCFLGVFEEGNSLLSSLQIMRNIPLRVGDRISVWPASHWNGHGCMYSLTDIPFQLQSYNQMRMGFHQVGRMKFCVWTESLLYEALEPHVGVSEGI